VREYEEYTVEDLLFRRGGYRIRWNCPMIPTPQLGSEGWVWTDGECGLLVLKYSQDGIEFSLLEPEHLEDGVYLRFGGFGIWHGDPEAACLLPPGGEVRFGLTRYELYDGGWEDGYRRFRTFMEGRGHRVPEGYDPPVHWNELYDNPLWWGPDTPERRRKLYTLEDMEEEARKARELGCEALYLDPGWDTSFASSIWDEERLGSLVEFVRRMQRDYGLKVALHTPLAAWSDPKAYPKEALRKDEKGEVIEGSLCSGARQYLEVKRDRLWKLAEAGVAFLMFDGSAYTGPCYDSDHGHPIPYTREAHCRSYLWLAQEVHRRFPDVLIELHDPIVAGVPIRYVPTYYLHGLPGSHDENWAFEYMWDPMDDLLSGRAISLYYYNLAYSIPLYLHIDLRTDNPNALAFWWYASTVRHLGVGGRHPDDRVWEAHKRAMRWYKVHKTFYTRGVFLGLGEDMHIHVLPGEGAVVNVFNLSETPQVKEVVLDMRELGLPDTVSVRGAEFRQDGDAIRLKFRLPPLSPGLAEVLPR